MFNRPLHKLTTEDFQDGCCGNHHGYRNNVAPMLPTVAAILDIEMEQI